MPVSIANSRVIYDALKAADIRLISALPETWLVHLTRLADDDPEATLVRLAKEENEHTMGLASSIGLGLALCLPHEKVVVLGGDGSCLMNLGGLTTTSRYLPPNFVHIVFDNESLMSVGGGGDTQTVRG